MRHKRHSVPCGLRNPPTCGGPSGHAVAVALDLDLSEPADKASVKAVLKSLISDRWLREVNRKDDARKDRRFVVVGKKMANVTKTQIDGVEVDEISESKAIEW
jgi:hypothetical protein